MGHVSGGPALTPAMGTPFRPEAGPLVRSNTSATMLRSWRPSRQTRPGVRDDDSPTSRRLSEPVADSGAWTPSARQVHQLEGGHTRRRDGHLSAGPIHFAALGHQVHRRGDLPNDYPSRTCAVLSVYQTANNPLLLVQHSADVAFCDTSSRESVPQTCPHEPTHLVAGRNEPPNCLFKRALSLIACCPHPGVPPD